MSDDDHSEAIGELIGELIEPLVELLFWIGSILPGVVLWPLVLVLASVGLSFCAGWLP